VVMQNAETAVYLQPIIRIYPGLTVMCARITTSVLYAINSWYYLSLTRIATRLLTMLQPHSILGATSVQNELSDSLPLPASEIPTQPLPSSPPSNPQSPTNFTPLIVPPPRAKKPLPPIPVFKQVTRNILFINNKIQLLALLNLINTHFLCFSHLGKSVV
jgi:hypothetical protein